MIQLSQKLSNRNRVIEFSSIKCGFLSAYAKDPRLYIFQEVIEPGTIPLFIIGYITHKNHQRIMATDGENFCQIGYRSHDVYELVGNKVGPSKSQVQQVIKDYIRKAVSLSQ